MKPTRYRSLVIAVVLIVCGFAFWPAFDSAHTILASPVKPGPDLQGGMYVTMEVDIPGLLYESAQRDAIDESFEKVMEATRQEAATSDEAVLEIFTRNFDRIARPQGRTLLNYYDLGDLGSNANDDAVTQRLSRNIDDAVDQAIEVMRQRIDKYGVSETTIQKVAGRRIVLELPGVTDAEAVRSLLQTTARLEFKQVRNDADAVRLFQRIDQVLAGKISTDSHTEEWYAKLPEAERAAAYQRDHPFSTLFSTVARANADAFPQDAGGVYAMKNVPAGIFDFYTNHATIEKLKGLLARPEVRAVIPEDIQIAFSAHPEFGAENPETAAYGIYILNSDIELTGKVISDARADFDQQSGRPMVLMKMNADGASKWADITGRNIKKRIAIVLDSAVYSAPTVQNKITGGIVKIITSSRDVKEVNLLAIVLKTGALKVAVHIIEIRSDSGSGIQETDRE